MVRFIDYEYAAENPRGFDVANHFAEVCPTSPFQSFKLPFLSPKVVSVQCVTETRLTKTCLTMGNLMCETV